MARKPVRAPASQRLTTPAGEVGQARATEGESDRVVVRGLQRERIGPLVLVRQSKSDGRALLLYERAEEETA
jgi:hypothetical protein